MSVAVAFPDQSLDDTQKMAMLRDVWRGGYPLPLLVLLTASIIEPQLAPTLCENVLAGVRA